MKDIAKDLGVSLMTVSKALRGHADISEETRRRVQQRAQELDYRPNRIAQSLVTRRSYLVGLVIPDMMHSFFAEVARGVSKVLNPLGYQVLISNSEESAAAEVRQLEMLLSQRVDGLIVASSQANGLGDSFRKLQRLGSAFVLIDRQLEGLQTHFVGVDDEKVGALATSHLIDQGCRRIAHVRGSDVGTGLGRYRGYLKALEKHGMPVIPELITQQELHNGRGGYQAMRHLLALEDRPDGVFCYNDPVATGVMEAILESGLRMPDDIAVAGAGNISYSGLLRIPLTTVDQCSNAIGEKAASLLVESIEAKEPVAARTILFPPKLIVRQSSRRLGA